MKARGKPFAKRKPLVIQSGLEETGQLRQEALNPVSGSIPSHSPVTQSWVSGSVLAVGGGNKKAETVHLAGQT